jgi:hypothetical protein
MTQLYGKQRCQETPVVLLQLLLHFRLLLTDHPSLWGHQQQQQQQQQQRQGQEQPVLLHLAASLPH